MCVPYDVFLQIGFMILQLEENIRLGKIFRKQTRAKGIPLSPVRHFRKKKKKKDRPLKMEKKNTEYSS